MTWDKDADQPVTNSPPQDGLINKWEQAKEDKQPTTTGAWPLISTEQTQCSDVVLLFTVPQLMQLELLRAVLFNQDAAHVEMEAATLPQRNLTRRGI